MPRVTLAKSIRLPGDRLRRVGEVLDVSDEVYSRYQGFGVFAVEPAAPAPAVADSETEPVDHVPEEPPMKRPARTAPVDMWRAYAQAQGIDPKGLTKQELIAATS